VRTCRGVLPREIDAPGSAALAGATEPSSERANMKERATARARDVDINKSSLA
jgi:hypothetical protein